MKKRFDHQSETYLTVDDAEIYYEQIGLKDRPALLVIHGGLGEIEEFNTIVSGLSERYRIIGIDCRGHGKSTLGSKKLTYKLLQEDIETLINHLNLGEISIIGFSNGGTIAYRLAAFTSLPISKLVTIGAPWCNDHLSHLMGSFSQLTSEAWKIRSPADYQTYMRLNPKPQFELAFQQILQMALDDSDSSRPNHAVKNISCPLLVIRGEFDPIFAEDHMHELRDLVPGSRTLTIPSIGHGLIPLGENQVFMSHLLSFLIPNLSTSPS